MSAESLSEIMEKLVGVPPEGLEWLFYLGSFLLVFFGLIITLSIIKEFFTFFGRK